MRSVCMLLLHRVPDYKKNNVSPTQKKKKKTPLHLLTVAIITCRIEELVAGRRRGPEELRGWREKPNRKKAGAGPKSPECRLISFPLKHTCSALECSSDKDKWALLFQPPLLTQPVMRCDCD